MVFPQTLLYILVAVVAADGGEPLGGHRGEVCGAVCHPAGGHQHSRGPLDPARRPAPLTGIQRVHFYCRGNTLWMHNSGWHQMLTTSAVSLLSAFGTGGRRKAPPGSGPRPHPAAPAALCHSLRSSFCLVEQKVCLYCTVLTLVHVAFAWCYIERTLSTLLGLPWWLSFCLSNQWSRRWLLQLCFSVPSDRKQPAQRVHAQVWAPCTLSTLCWTLSLDS